MRGVPLAFLAICGLVFCGRILPVLEAEPYPQDSTQHVERSAGTFELSGQKYTVSILGEPLTGAVSAEPVSVSGLEVRDSTGSVSYRETFRIASETGRSRAERTVSVDAVAGKTGGGLLVHLATSNSSAQPGEPAFSESWQFLSAVNSKIVSLGAPTKIGGPGAGQLMGVMVRAPNGAVTMLNQPDEIELRAWTGNFYFFVPLRVDWNRGAIGEGQRCVTMLGGSLRDVGCDMRVEANRKPAAGEFAFLRLFPEPYENPEAAEHAVVQKNSRFEILGGRAMTSWSDSENLAQPVFSDVWLHVRLDARDGWIHGEEDFAAIGLPAGSPER